MERHPARVDSTTGQLSQRVLVADDDASSRAQLADWVRAEYRRGEVAVETAAVAQLMSRLNASRRRGELFDLVILSEPVDPSRLIPRLRHIDATVPVVLVRGKGDQAISNHVDAMLEGPIEWEIFRMVLRILLPLGVGRRRVKVRRDSPWNHRTDI